MLRRLLITGFLSLCALCSVAQNVRDIKINEILVHNENNLVDDYGSRSGWIELYNTSHSVIDLGGCYLSVAKGNKTLTYQIPTSDHRTKIEPLQYVIFYCDGISSKGTFYTNFTLDRTGTLMLLNASEEIIDKVNYAGILSKLGADAPLIRVDYDNDKLDTAAITTALASNTTEKTKSGSELFQERDPRGVVLAITAICVVFSALLALFLLFRLVGFINVTLLGRKAKQKITVTPIAQSGESDEVVAAIALAFKLHQEDLHDKESTVLTINRVARAYSPWSSKIYGINQLPNKK